MRMLSVLLFLGTVAFVMSFTNARRSSVGLTSDRIVINIDDREGMLFLDRWDLLRMLKDLGADTLGNTRVEELDLKTVESEIEKNPYVRSAEVYTTLDGMLYVNLQLRKPIVRVLHANGMGNYIDEDGEYVPLSRKYTARVPIVSGEINESRFRSGISEMSITDKDTLLYDEIYALASFIQSNETWNAQIEQVVVDKNHEFTLIPKVGDHKIVIGKPEGLNRKFRKLELFYREGLSNTGWKAYDTINLKYRDQVVCTKK